LAIREKINIGMKPYGHVATAHGVYLLAFF